MFAYCDNNPVNRIDVDGQSSEAAIGLLTSLLGLIDGPLPVGEILSLSLLALVADTLDSDDVYEKKAQKAQAVAESRAKTKERKQAYFPENPYQFRPKGLEMKEYVAPGLGKNGGIIKWVVPNTKTAVFEWNEYYRFGPHYHVMKIEWDGKHMGDHYVAGTPVPEPWNSIYFGD